MGKLLSSLEQNQSILCVDSCTSWQEGIKICFSPLVKSGAVTPEYVEATIQSGIELNFYYLIAPGLAMPHARPEQGALKNALSLLVVTNGVDFEGHRNGPVQCFLGLAAVDSNSHIDAMMEISEIFSNEDVLPQLAQCKTPELVKEYLKSLLS